MAGVLIVGATSAIAGEMAKRHAARGDRLFLIARDAGRLAALRAELGDTVVGSRSGDFDDTGEAAGHVEAAIQSLGQLDVVVIAHGWLGDQLRSESDLAHAEAVIRTNLESAIAFLLPLGNYFERRPGGGGSIAVLSSVAGDRGRPRNYTYAAAKAGLNVYLQGLRSRLHEAGTRVHIFRLGPVDTPMTTSHEKNASFARADDVAATLIRHVDRGVVDAYVPAFWRPVMFAVRVMPEWLFQRLGFLSDH